MLNLFLASRSLLQREDDDRAEAVRRSAISSANATDPGAGDFATINGDDDDDAFATINDDDDGRRRDPTLWKMVPFVVVLFA